jgi:uncharacterized protein (DUF1501 family)
MFKLQYFENIQNEIFNNPINYLRVWLIMTFSEFGRRVAQNASAGTDHGTANNMFFIGGSLKQKGIINELPDLGNLKDGDLQHTIDFKNIYATVLNNWLGSSVPTILGQDYKPIAFI